MKYLKLWCSAVLLNFLLSSCSVHGQEALESFDVGHTVVKVRYGEHNGQERVIASSYEGAILAIDLDGNVLWENKLSGYMNHDVWVQDVNGDGSSEIYAANADGSVYALNAQGELQWSFKPSEAPMNSVTVIRGEQQTYIAAGGYDLNFYWLDLQGQQIKTVSSTTYSNLRPWGEGRKPKNDRHSINFLRPIPQPNNTDNLLVHGLVHSLAGSGALFEFLPEADSPFRSKSLSNRVVGDLRVVDVNGDYKALMGTSALTNGAGFNAFDIESQSDNIFRVSDISSGIDNFGYRVAQTDLINTGAGERYFTLYGARVLLTPVDLDASKTEVLASRYSYNDVWKFPNQNKFVFASAQSGGSAIHILDTDRSGWKSAYESLEPPGNIQKIVSNSEQVRQQLMTFTKPEWEKKAQTVWLMSENTASLSGEARSAYQDIVQNYDSPVFLKSFWTSRAEDWDRSGMQNQKYRDRRDGRRTYNLTQDEFINDIVAPNYQNQPGVSFWGGHGNDPYMFSPETMRRVMDLADNKKTILIYPELEGYDADAEWMVNDLLYPHAEYGRSRNIKFYLRNKHTFWQSIVYQPAWSRLMSGEFHDVFIPAMEETTDKSMELSVSARTGVWMSGVVDEWGARIARDSTSFDRTRQFSHQMLPNGYLREMIYAASLGARSFDNFPIDQNYMSLFWTMIAKGLIYIPQRNELLSLSPVHLSMTAPDQRYLEEGNDVKWTSYFDAQEESENPMVFSRLNGTWPGAPLTDWDFSRYAAGVTERRLNFLPPYKHGLVLITPPQDGSFVQANHSRPAMEDLMHPFYKNIRTEYYSDGRNYYSSDGLQTFSADEYYSTIAADIETKSDLLPVTVSGDVAWVVAQSGPKNLRLTILDSGFINPSEKTATVSFSGITVTKATDLLSGSAYQQDQNGELAITIPEGMFKFVDIEFSGAISTPEPMPSPTPTSSPSPEPSPTASPEPTPEPSPSNPNVGSGGETPSPGSDSSGGGTLMWWMYVVLLGYLLLRQERISFLKIMK